MRSRSLHADEEVRRLGDQALAVALHDGDARVMREFVRRFRRLLAHRIRAAGLDPRECENEVMDVLFRITAGLSSGKLAVPRSVAGYVVQSFWRRWRRRQAQVARRDERMGGAPHAVAGVSEPIVASACSEYTRRLAAGPEWEPERLSPALERLVISFVNGLSEDDHRLLVWLSHLVPQRTIAEWMGATYGATVQRIWRLRERLRDGAVRYAQSLPPTERRELMRFFRRTTAMRDAIERGGRSRRSAPLATTGDSPASRGSDRKEDRDA